MSRYTSPVNSLHQQYLYNGSHESIQEFDLNSKRNKRGISSASNNLTTYGTNNLLIAGPAQYVYGLAQSVAHGPNEVYWKNRLQQLISRPKIIFQYTKYFCLPTLKCTH